MVSIARGRSHRLTFLASALLLVLVLASGLWVLSLPSNARTSGATGFSTAALQAAYQAYRQGERAEAGNPGDVSGQGAAAAAYQLYRADERADLGPNEATQAWLDHQSSERSAADARAAWLAYRAGERGDR